MTEVVRYEKEPLPAPTAIEASANALVVVDDDTDQFAAEVIGELMTERDGFVAKKARYMGLIQPLIDEINGDFNPVIASYNNAIATIKSKRKNLLTQRQEAARIAQAAAVQAAAEQKAKMAAEAKAAADAGHAVEAAAITEAATFVAPAAIEFAKPKGAREAWVGTVTDSKAFLAWLIESGVSPDSVIDFKQAGLNSLAKTFSLGLPGFTSKQDWIIPGRRAA